jgi:protein-S-isoprenylcysteine O-methyltransferase Ste14
MKLLPPALAGLLIIAMGLLGLLLPGPVIVPRPYNWLGLLGLAGGFAASVIAARQFERVGTNIKPFKDPTLFVTDGLFKWTRNPMYLGITLLLTGIAVLIGTLSPFLGPIVFAVTADRWYIRLEEQAMQRKFGERYTAYRRVTRRWI